MKEREKIKRSVPSFAHKISMLKEANNHFYEQFHNCPDNSRERMPVSMQTYFWMAKLHTIFLLFWFFLSHVLHLVCVFQFYCPLLVFLYTISLFPYCFLLLAVSVKCIYLLFILILFTPLNIHLKGFHFFTLEKRANMRANERLGEWVSVWERGGNKHKIILRMTSI